MRFLAVPFAVPLALLLASCASTGPRPGTGDIAFRLTWTGLADLDLYAVSPLGEQIDFNHRSVASGGTLDIDCNVGLRLCPYPMENIFWPRGRAPSGVYEYWVYLANADRLQPEDTYRLLVFFDGEVAIELTGRARDLEEEPVLGKVQTE